MNNIEVKYNEKTNLYSTMNNNQIIFTPVNI